MILMDRDRLLTSVEVDPQARQVAQRLFHTGLTGEEIVGLMVKRPVGLFVGCSECVKAGGAM